MRELTPEEQAILDGMAETVTTPKFDVDDTLQRKLLSALLQCPQSASDGLKFVQADFFSNEAHVIACRILLAYWKENQSLPTKFVVTDAMQDMLKEKEPEVQLHYMAEIHSVYDYFLAGLPDNKYIVAKMREWAKKQTVRLAASKLVDNAKADEIIAALQTGIDTARRFDGDTQVSDDWNHVVESMESEEWLIPNWLEFGSLGMLSGDPFSGKSHIMAEIMAAIFQHGKFCRYEVPKCAVLVVDAENKKRIFVKRLNGALGEGNTAAPQGLLRRVDSTKIKLPIPVESAPETIRALIHETKKTTGQQRVFVLIDTLRSVLGADEMEGGEMKDLLYPLQRVAQEENAAILILHHRPKSGATYSGQTSIAGALDFLWLWESDIETGLGKLSLKGTRGDHEPALQFALQHGKNNWIGDSETSAVSMIKKSDKLVEMLDHILADGPRTQSEVVQQIQNLWTEGTAPGRDKIIALLTAQVGSILMVSKGEKNSTLYRLLGT